MRIAILACGAGLVLLVAGGCDGKSSGSAPAARTASVPSANDLAPLDRALPKLPTIKLWLGDQELVTEVARRRHEIMTGMMYRTNIAEDEAMLFLLQVPQRASFYMRNTTVPLSAAYLDPEGTILEIHPLQPLDEKPVEAAASNVLYVLETSQGWFDRHQIKPGAVVRTQYGPLRAMDWTRLRLGAAP